MTSDELKEELRAINDLNVQLTERIKTLSRRLHRHFDPPTDHRLTMVAGPRQWPSRTRDDEDDGGD